MLSLFTSPSLVFMIVLVLFTLACTQFLFPTCDAAPVPFLSRIQTMFSFGDSYTTQNLDTVTMSYACRNCTSAGGPNWVEYLVDMHPMQHWNLAYNSAPILNALVDQPSSPVIDVATQVTKLYPQHFGDSKADRDPSRTLYTIWVGINDINLTARHNNTSELDDQLMDQYRTLLQYLEWLGARQFMLINVPPIDRSPMWRERQEGTFQETIRKRVQGYNSKLAALCDDLKHSSNSSTATFTLFDAWSTFNHILDHPNKYGFVHTKSYCPDWSLPDGCEGSLEEYFWYNDLHPTYKVHEYLAKAIANFLA